MPTLCNDKKSLVAITSYVYRHRLEENCYKIFTYKSTGMYHTDDTC